ncbi:hypothetical protein ABB37_08741 [Leptomonas pyrrhocoris]|uniref:EF-hand domain-containing protein n=1 Tax=Leptomonas pyrrhocoris TaxID=157538 RepID=A0A0M9FSG3_LEPPY|nr:hypothetical protein ABB37_08741 [Leptomonas pyrrhocoris]KPA75057.1 hypothetical protein ABB37_08741 [Leptomonas pyrrhocoris]|eukprot:XP_015653496.1 hypothetical protein ABB37_08741 [Leptomonas pyrrhocoris]
MTSLNNNNIREDVIFKGKVKDALLRNNGSGGLVNVLLDFNARDAAAVAAQNSVPSLSAPPSTSSSSSTSVSATASSKAGLTYAEFLAFMSDHEVELTPFEQQYLCRAFDDSGAGVISAATFTRHLTGLNERRICAVRKAWAALEGKSEETSNAAVTREVLFRSCHAPSQQRSALTRTFSDTTREQLKESFLATTTGRADATDGSAAHNDNGNPSNDNDDAVDYAEFLAFYAGVSAQFGTDEDFEMHVLKSWAADDTTRPKLGETAREWGPAGDPLALDGPRYVRDALNRQLGLSSKSYNFSHMKREHPYVEPLPPLNRPDIMTTTMQKTYVRFDAAGCTLADPLSTRRGQVM